MPSLSGPKISMPDVDFNLKGAKLKGDVDVSVPKIEGHIKGPDVDIKGPELEMESRKGGFELPKFKMPKFGFKGPKVECPDVDVNLPKADIDVKAPDVDFTAPAIDIEGPGATIKGPKFKIPDITGPKMPEWDLKLKSPKLPGGVSVSLPAAEGDIKGPEVDVDIDGEKGGIKMPTFKLPSFGISGPKSPSLDVDLKVQKPDIDIQAPEGTIKGPHFDIHGPSGEIKMPSISMPKISIPDVNLDLQGPKLKGDLDFTVPKIEGEITSPNLDTKGPEFEIERKNHGYEMPKINMPKFGLKAPTVAGAEIDVNLPKADFDLKADDVDITPPAIDIEVPDRKVKGAKFKIPNVKGPEFDPHVSLTKIEGEAKAPDVDMHLKGSKLKLAIDLQKTEYTGPDINIDATDIGTKKPKFKIPKFGFKGSKIKTPDADLKIAGDIGVSPQIGSEDLEIDMGLTGPKTKGAKFKIPKLGFKSPKIELPAVDVNLPKVDFESKTPDIDLPNVKIEGAKLEMPNTSGPKLSLPDMDFNLEGPKAEGDMDVSLPEIEGVIEAPDIDVDGHKGGFKMPKIKMPTLGLKGTGFDGSNIEINLPKAEVDVKGLELNIEGKPGNIQGPKFSMPSISGSKPPMPDVDLSLQGPKLKGEVDMPGMEIKGGLSVDTKGQDIKGPKGEFNMPKIKMPSMNIIGSNVEGVDVALSSPKANINIEKPDFEEPEANIKGPNFNMMQISGHKISMPNMDFNSKGPTLKGDVDAFVPKIDGDITNANVNIKGPEVRIDPAKTSVTFPKFKGPRLGMKSPEIGGTDPTVNTPIVNVGAKGSRTKHSLPDTEASLDVPDIDISGKGKTGKFRLPKVKAKAKKTDFEIETPAKNLDVDTPNVPIKGTKVKKPLFGIHFPNVEFDIKSPKIKVDDLPSANLDTTNDSPNVSFEGPDVKLKTPKMPNVNISATDFDTNLITYEEANVAAGFNVEGDAKIDTGVPEGSASGGLHYPQGIVTFPKMKVPRFGIALPQLETQRGGGNVKLEFASEGAHLQGPSISGQVISQTVEVPSPELRDTGGKVKVKRPKMFGKSKAKGSSAGDLQGPEIGLSASGKDVKVSKDLELEGHSGLSVSTKGKSASLDLFKKSRQRSSSSMSDEGGLAISSPSGHLETEGGDISVDLGKSKVKGKKGKLKFGTFGGFGSKSKGSYEVTLGDNSDAGMEGNVGGSLPSKKSRLSSSSSSDSGSRGFRFPRLELSVSPKND